jgi:hypothetical protein
LAPGERFATKRGVLGREPRRLLRHDAIVPTWLRIAASRAQIVHAVVALMIDPGEGAKFSVRRGPGEMVRSGARHGSRLEHGADLLRTLVEGHTDETEVWVEGGGPVEVAFGERPSTINQGRYRD